MIRSIFEQEVPQANGTEHNHLSDIQDDPLDELDASLDDLAARLKDHSELYEGCIEAEEKPFEIESFKIKYNQENVLNLNRFVDFLISHNIQYTVKRIFDDCNVHVALTKLNQYGQTAFYCTLDSGFDAIIIIRPSLKTAFRADNWYMPQKLWIYHRTEIISHHTCSFIIGLTSKLAAIIPHQSTEELLAFLYHCYIKKNPLFSGSFSFINELSLCQTLNVHALKWSSRITSEALLKKYLCSHAQHLINEVDHVCQMYAKKLLLYIILTVADIKDQMELPFGDPTFAYENLFRI